MNAGTWSGEPDQSDADRGFEKILDAAESLVDLPDLARVDAWTSSALGVWSEAPDAGSIDEEFVGWLVKTDRTDASLLLIALSRLIAIDERVLAPARDRLEDAPPWVGLPATAEPLRAWQVIEGAVTSVGIGFVLGDGSEHSLLADIVDGQLDSLIVGPGPEDLFDGAEDLVDPLPLDAVAAAEAIVVAWRLLDERGLAVPESVYVNGALACCRLAVLINDDLRPLIRPPLNPEAPLGPEPITGIDVDPAERAELNRWALSVLDGAGIGAGTAGSAILRDPLEPARAGAYPAAEREAFEALEWADWLGIVVGLSRLGEGESVDPARLIDLINRCPEVTSTIPKRDRLYYEWVFSMVLPLWREAGVIDEDGVVTAGGAAQLVGAVRAAWRDDADE